MNPKGKKDRDAEVKQLRKANVKLFKDSQAIVSRSAIVRGEDSQKIVFNGGGGSEWQYASKEIKTRASNKNLLWVFNDRGADDDPVHHQKIFASTRLVDCPHVEIDVSLVTEQERAAYLEEITTQFNVEVERITQLLNGNVIDVPARNARMLAAEDHQARLLQDYHLKGRHDIFERVQKRAAIVRQQLA